VVMCCLREVGVEHIAECYGYELPKRGWTKRYISILQNVNYQHKQIAVLTAQVSKVRPW